MDNSDAIPEWLRSHPELKKRGIILTWVKRPVSSAHSMWRSRTLRSNRGLMTQDPCVFFGYTENGPRCVVKTVRQGSEEAAIYQHLQREPHVVSDHILPCEVVGDGDVSEPLLVFPYLNDSATIATDEWPLSRLLGFVHQVLVVSSSPAASKPGLRRTRQGLDNLHKHRIAHMVRVYPVPVTQISYLILRISRWRIPSPPPHFMRILTIHLFHFGEST